MKKFIVLALAVWFGFSFAQDTTSQDTQDTTSCAALLGPQDTAKEQITTFWANLRSVKSEITSA